MTRTMFDAEVPPEQYPAPVPGQLGPVTVAAGYVAGGHGAHAWSADEWERVRSWPAIEAMLPIYVGSPAEGPAGAASRFAAELAALGVPRGSTVCLDWEQRDLDGMVHAGYTTEFWPVVEAAGYLPLDYCSRSNMGRLGGRPIWAAQWLDGLAEHEVPGAAATQWYGGPGKPIDVSTITAALPLWPNRPPTPDPGGPMHPGTAIFPSPSGNGYYVVTADGGVFCFGDATFHGSLGGKHLASPIVAGAAHPRGGGYWLLGEDRGVFAFGDAHYHGGPDDLDQPAHSGPHPAAEVEAAEVEPEVPGPMAEGTPAGL
jgi:hypothetical protein